MAGNRSRKPGWLTRPRVRFLHPPPSSCSGNKHGGLLSRGVRNSLTPAAYPGFGRNKVRILPATTRSCRRDCNWQTYSAQTRVDGSLSRDTRGSLSSRRVPNEDRTAS